MPSIRGLSLKSALLLEAGFCHGFSTRAAATSDGFAAFLTDAGIDSMRLRQAHQVHGARVVRATACPSLAIGSAPAPMLEADALVAAPPLAVAVRVADCVPVLLADPVSGVVAAVHAGWRGLVSGVIGAAADEMSALAADEMSALAGNGARGEWLAAIGPCIGPCCFEVGVDVARSIAAAVEDDSVVVRAAGDKAFVDLRAGVRRRLAAAGFVGAHVEDVAGCTKCDAAQFFSYRRDGAGAGRLFGAIAPRAR
jgi:polyphenol oxidase